MKKNHITLTEADNSKLAVLFSKGILSVRTQKRGHALQLLDKGGTYRSVSEQLNVSYPSVFNWASSYRKDGLVFLKDKARKGRPVEFSGTDRANITALACTTPPQGHARWSLRLLSDRLVELELVEAISHSSVGLILKKTNSNPIGSGNGASGS